MTDSRVSQWNPNHFVSCMKIHVDNLTEGIGLSDRPKILLQAENAHCELGADIDRVTVKDYEYNVITDDSVDMKSAEVQQCQEDICNADKEIQPKRFKLSSSTETYIHCYDVGNIVEGKVELSSLSDAEKKKYLKDHFCPGPDDDVCTQVKHRPTQKRSTTLVFQRSWLDKHKWLVYSPSMKGGLCKMCILFPHYQKGKGNITIGTLVKTPLVNLSKATGKYGILETHQNAQYHMQATEAATDFMELLNRPEKSLPYKISRQNKDMYDLNCHILKSICEIIVCCGRQGLPLRGHRDDSTSKDANKGNFNALLNLLAKACTTRCNIA